MAARRGDTLLFPTPPVVAAHAAIGGKKEGEGPLAACFDALSADNFFGQSSWEAAEKELAGTLTSCTLVVLSALLTTLGLYQKLAAKAGAGTLVPITGFANAVVSAAIEFKTEGRVLGTGAKMFIIAGPVIVYGTLAAVLYGSVYWLLQ